ncbi:Pentatricopeptide repeat-containing protein At4g13650 [Linum perenne]
MSIVLCVSPQAFSQTHKNGEIRRRDDADKDWSRIIRNHARMKNDEAILSAFTEMEAHGVCPDRDAVPLVFKACSGLNAVEKGRKLHGRIRGSNHLIGDVRVCTAVVDFYCKCGFVEEAFQVFDEMRERDLVLWNAMISGFVGCGCFVEAIGLFRMMRKDGFRANSRTLVQLLLACQGVLELRLGKEVHGYCLRNGYFDLDPHMGTALVGFYMNFDVWVSGLVFDSMEVRSSVSWNAMMTGYFDAGYPLLALELFFQMLELGVKLDSVTILVAVQACSELGSLKLGMQIHQLATKLSYGKDLFIENALLNMYSDLRSLNSARKIFDRMRIRDAALWNSMIAAFIEHGYRKEATELFIRMGTREATTFVVMLSSCGEAADGLELGRMLHAHAIKSRIETNVSVGNALLTMYVDRNCVEAAKKVFFSVMKEAADVVSYNTLILALASSSYEEAWGLFGEMLRSEIVPNAYTMVSLLASCRDEMDLNSGRSIHGFVVKHGFDLNSALNTALTAMYMTCGDESTARDLFEACSRRDLISWNAMIGSYAKRNQTEEAMALFSSMISEVEPNPVTVISILSTCTHLPWGQQLHAYATRQFNLEPSLANPFITMYARCGSLKNAETIFRNLQDRNLISWNAMINAYSTHGSSTKAISTFVQMLEDGFHPNGVTFLSILSSCRHSGLVTKGLQIFHSMVHHFNLTPSLSHYGCIVDLLIRGKFLIEAYELVNSMPIQPDASIWRALLNGCRFCSNPEMAASVFQELVRLEPTNPANYVLLANIYAASGLWSEVRSVRNLLKKNSLKKAPGISWIVVQGRVHSFAAADTSHPDSVLIYSSLESLLDLIRHSGYVTQYNTHEED